MSRCKIRSNFIKDLPKTAKVLIFIGILVGRLISSVRKIRNAHVLSDIEWVSKYIEFKYFEVTKQIFRID